MTISVYNNNTLVSTLQETNPVTLGVGFGVDGGSLAASASASAQESAEAAATAAYMALVGTGAGFDTPDDLANSTVVYGTNTLTHSGETVTLTVAVGDIWAVKTGAAYEVVAADATTYDVLTAGGVKLVRHESTGLVASEVAFTPTDDIQADDVQKAIKLVQSQATASAGTATTDSNTYTDTKVSEVKAWINGGALYGDNPGEWIGTIVVIGSSTLAGTMTTNNVVPSEDNHWTAGPNCCVTLLANAIAGRGTVINRSVPGANMYTQREAFWTRVAPYRPRFVIIGTGFINESGSDGRTKSSWYIRHMTAIVGMCRSIGATPILWACNPINTLTADDRAAMRTIKRAAARMGVRMWDLSAATATDDYQYKSGLCDDSSGLHGNDACHLLYFKGINFADFRAEGPLLNQTKSPMNYRLTASANNAAPPLRCYFDTEEDKPYSWSIFCRVKRPSAVTAQARVLLADNGAEPAILVARDVTGVYRVTQDGVNIIMTTVDASAAGTDELLLIYDQQDSTLKLWINGTLAGTATGITLSRMTEATWGGLTSDANYNAIGWYLEDFRVWRVPFLTTDAQSLFAGERPTEGIAIDVNMSSNVRGSAVNDAGNTSVRPLLGLAYSWVAV